MGADFPCLYRYSLEEARRYGETRLHEESFRQNVSCALAIEQAIRGYFNEANRELAEGGFGCSPSARGRAVYATCLGDGERTRWNREDFAGVLKEKFLPGWAQARLEELRRQEQRQINGPAMGGIE